MDNLESHQRLLAGEVLVAQPAMIESVALILASTLGSAASVAMLRENAAALDGVPNHGESEWHQNHIAIGRNMAAACILRTATLLEMSAEGAARIAPGSDEVH